MQVGVSEEGKQGNPLPPQLLQALVPHGLASSSLGPGQQQPPPSIVPAFPQCPGAQPPSLLHAEQGPYGT